MWTWFDELAFNIREDRKKMAKYNYECTNSECKYVEEKTVRHDSKNVKKCPKCGQITFVKTIALDL